MNSVNTRGQAVCHHQRAGSTDQRMTSCYLLSIYQFDSNHMYQVNMGSGDLTVYKYMVSLKPAIYDLSTSYISMTNIMIDYECLYRGGGVLHQIFGSQIQHAIKKWDQSDLRFCKNKESHRSKVNENWANWIENQEDN